MKPHILIPLCAILQFYSIAASADTVIITADTTIAVGDLTTIEGRDVIVNEGVVLTVAGTHAINAMTVAGTVTHVPEDTNGLSLVISGMLTVQAGGRVDATGKGYRGGQTWSPGGVATTTNAATDYSGGSYGGIGYISHGFSYSNPTYGFEQAPAELGSGGGQGGSGGGRVDISAGSILVDGQIIADGHSGSFFSGGGSGGAIWLRLNGGGISGSGTIRAAGGSAFSGGIGGGGRIAVVGFSTNGFVGLVGPAGTVLMQGAAEIGASLKLDRAEVRIPVGETRTWAVIETTTNRSTIHNQGKIAMSTDALSVPSVLTLIQDGVIKGASRTNDAIGALTIRHGAVLTHTPRSCRGVQLRVLGSLIVESNGVIDVTGKGYGGGGAGLPGNGNGETWGGECLGTRTGGSNGRAGGSYGTLGTSANFFAVPNALYGSACAPVELGSGGGSEDSDCFGGSGGGRIDIEAGNMVVDGQVLSRGGGALSPWCGGGSGGAVFIRIKGGLFSGAGVISIHGGTNPFGHPKGGGGRIAVIGHGANTFNGTLGGEGTLCLQPGSVPAISRVGDQIAVSWPAVLQEFTLESSENLSPSGWLPVTNAPVIAGEQLQILLDPASERRFFQLKK